MTPHPSVFPSAPYLSSTISSLVIAFRLLFYFSVMLITVGSMVTYFFICLFSNSPNQFKPPPGQGRVFWFLTRVPIADNIA